MARILLVEDNEMNRDMLSRRLVRNDHEVSIAIDGQQGVDMAISLRPDLILMDMSLPVIDGWEATRQIRANDVTRKIPVIALTANPSDEDRTECLEAGMDGFLTKPFTGAQFMKAIRVYLTDLREDRAKTNPLYDFAVSLEDTDAELFGDSPRSMH